MKSRAGLCTSEDHSEDNDMDRNSQPGTGHLVMVSGLFACLCELCFVLTLVGYNTNIFGQTLLERFQFFKDEKATFILSRF